MSEYWKKIEKINLEDTNTCINFLKSKGYILSPRIENIFSKKNYFYKEFVYPIKLHKVKVSDLNINEPIELESLYKLLDNKNYELVHPAIALYSRLIYDEQKTGEWLRFATHFDSMIDDDKVPHLPKLGKALGKYFIETYWSYRKAVFHPHNDFIVKEK